MVHALASSRLKPVLLKSSVSNQWEWLGRTELMVHSLASSRLKPVPLRAAHACSEFGGDPAGLFPAKAGPTKKQRVHAAKLAVIPPASPRLKPVLRKAAGAVSGTGFSREAFDLLFIFEYKKLSHRQSRLWCRPNVDDAEWAERHGCRESAARTWMSVRRGPTERRRSEGTRRSRAKPRASTLGYLGCFSK